MPKQLKLLIGTERNLVWRDLPQEPTKCPKQPVTSFGAKWSETHLLKNLFWTDFQWFCQTMWPNRCVVGNVCMFDSTLKFGFKSFGEVSHQYTVWHGKRKLSLFSHTRETCVDSRTQLPLQARGNCRTTFSQGKRGIVTTIIGTIILKPNTKSVKN